MLLALAFSFIYAYSMIDPHVYQGGLGVDDSVPHLCDASLVPAAEGGVELSFPRGAIPSA